MQRIWFLSLGVIMFILLNCCEVDDICVEPVLTPRLSIKFKNITYQDSIKTVDSISVWALGKDSIYKKQTMDSLLLPLNPYDTITTYILSNHITKPDTLRVHYKSKSVFVSRSCGYKYEFTVKKETNYTNHWLKQSKFVKLPLNISDESNTALYLYH